MADEPNAPPSIDPADLDSLEGAFRAILTKFLQNVDDCLPAVVIAVAESRNRVTVQPQVMVGTTDQRKVSRAQVASVPILNMGAGGFVLSFPVKAGDFGWIKASDRDISLFLQSLGEDTPNTRRMHSFQDGVFIPHAMRAWTLNPADADRVVLQSTDGVTRIALGADTVEITTSGVVKVTAPTVHMTGDLNVDGSVTSHGVVLHTHHHTGVTVGGGNTGGPV